jgi:peptide deformylase
MSSHLLPIAQLGDPILRTPAQTVTTPISGAIAALIEDLTRTMTESAGVGIAAPQVSQSQQIAIVASRPTLRYPHAPTLEPCALINPVLTKTSSEIVGGWEGCLSVPGIRGYVPRYEWVVVRYLTPNGQAKQERFSGFVARIIQHECDHLRGILFIDRVESTTQLMSEQEYMRRVLATIPSAEQPT